jgi:hypothetical protein
VAVIITLIKFQTRSFSFGSTFTRKLAGKTNLKEFYKYTHPDLLAGASRKVTEQNTASI